MGIIRFFAEGVMGVLTPLCLLGVGVFLLVWLKAFPFFHPLGCIRLLKSKDKEHKGGALSAFFMALAGTLGVGNISGVALALSVGGAGSLLWMWISALLAMLIKYAEVVLSLDRLKGKTNPPIHTSLGYVYARLPRFSGLVATLFGGAILLCSLILGGMIQSNAVAEIFASSFGFPPVLVGVILFLLTIVVIFGGGKRISAVTFRLIPVATFLYAFLCLGVIWTFRGRLPQVLKTIFVSGLSFRSASGGVLGYGMLLAVREGCTRGLLSNEAGCGTAPMAHATSTAASPEKQGIWGIFEVFVDTVFLCSLTGFAVLVSGIPLETGVGSMASVMESLAVVWGKAASVLLAFSVFLFAFATVICWSFYGSVGLSLFTHSKKVYRGFCWCFGGAVLLGALIAPGVIWYLTDILLGVMTLLNLYAILRHRDRLKDSLLALPFMKRK